MNSCLEEHEKEDICQRLSGCYLNMCIAGVRLENSALNNYIPGWLALSGVYSVSSTIRDST